MLAASVALVLIGGWAGAQAQISSVTRRTVQQPFPAMPLVQPGQPGLPAVGGAGGANLTPNPRVYYRPPVAAPSAGQLEERERRRLEFEIQCAERGLPSFQFSLAGRYLQGNGVRQDPEKALELLRRAAAQNHDQARRVLEEYDRLVAARGQTGEEPAAKPEDPEPEKQ